MKVVLTRDVEGVGTKGSVVTVAPGFARNFLIPRGIAIKATKASIKQAEDMRRAREAAEARALERARELERAIAGSSVEIQVRVGKQGKLYGSVTAQDISRALHERLGVEIDRRQIDLPEPLRRLGEHEVGIKLHPQVSAILKVRVSGEEA